MTEPTDTSATPVLSGRVQDLWKHGDWFGLAALSLDEIDPLADRADLALLIASAHFHHGNRLKTRAWIRQAIDWGAEAHAVRAILVAGLQNTLGRIALILGHTHQSIRLFEASVAPVVSSGSADYAGFARRVAETARMKLFPEAVQLLEDEFEATDTHDTPSDARLSVLETGLELINHELTISLKRGQIGKEEKCADGEADPASYAKAQSLSQLGQDVWVLENTGFKRNGFFVEFGATNGVLLSNTYLLETGFGWSGICAEPNPVFFEQLQRNRQCVLSQDCIAGETGKTVEFIMADAYGGIRDYVNSDSHGTKRDAYVAYGNVVELTTVSLDDFLKKYGAPKTIDYLSIDTEGSEYEILAAFPFDDWDIRMLTVEHNYTPAREQIRTLLEGHGYTQIEAEWDDWYIRQPAS